MRSLFFLIVLLAVCDVWADPPSSKPNNAAPAGQIVDSRSAKGWLYYSYTEHWGHKPPQKPHYLVGQPIAFSILEK